MARLLAHFAAIGATPADTEHERLQRGLLVGLSLLISVLAIFWGLAYIVFGEPLGGAIPLTYTVLSLLTIVMLTVTRRYDVFRFTQLSLMLALPFALMPERDRAFAAVHRLFGQSLSPQIVRSLLSDPGRAALGGENREVTALFADLAGFTPFTESRPPRETVLALNRYFSAVVPVVFANGGTIIQFAGDAIVAVWNAPVEQPRHALAAARTALAMQSAIEAIVAEDASLPRFRVGIATGAALVGNIGSEELRNYVAHGDAVNLAARLQTGAIPGQVVVSAPTYALIRDLASVRPLGRFAVKGKSEEVEAFVLEHLADS